jgi:TolB protein
MQLRFSYLLAATAVIGFLLSAASAHTLHSPGDAAFSGFNGKIAFYGDDASGIQDIYTMNLDGSAVTNLTNTPTLNEIYPSWSPDGAKIAFNAFADDIFVISADGTGITNITAASDTSASLPAWSPDGSRIAYACVVPKPGADGNEICVINTDGSGRAVLTDNNWVDTFPAWSPDGTRIAFASFETGIANIFLMDPDGSNQLNLTNDVIPGNEPAWSPDGSKIAFVGGNCCFLDIYSMEPDGTAIQQLTTTQPIESAPEWSPDGDFIVFEGAGLEIMRPDGSERMTLCGGFGFAPSWQPLTSPATPVVGAACEAGPPIILIEPSPAPAPTPSPVVVQDLPRTGGRAPSPATLPIALSAIAAVLLAVCLTAAITLTRR